MAKRSSLLLRNVKYISRLNDETLAYYYEMENIPQNYRFNHEML